MNNAAEARRKRPTFKSRMSSTALEQKPQLPSIDPLLTPEETARLLGVTVKCLANWRLRGGERQLPFVQIGYNRIRYRQKDILDWIEARVRTSTSDDGEGMA